MSNSADDFYVGYAPETPGGIRTFVLRTVLFLGIGFTIAGGILFAGQQAFSNSVFEFGALTEITGIVHLHPVPHLSVLPSAEQTDLEDRVILLVGFGKFGAKGDLLAASDRIGIPIDGQQATLRGTLIYRDGKTLLELTENDAAVLAIQEGGKPQQVTLTELGPISLTGEILDAKCYFGVMKPGSGKPHRSCAIRCISGGVPPVILTDNPRSIDQHKEYVILVGPTGEMINDRVLDFVAEPVRLCGELQQLGDWLVCQVHLEEGIRPLRGLADLKSIGPCAARNE
ncbi:MAG: hypothetical protein AAGH79_11035 [Bacteroidota bacterium]